MEKLTKLNVGRRDSAELQVSAAEFVLEGLYAHKRIGRNEERLFTAGEKAPKVLTSHSSVRKRRFAGEGRSTSRWSCVVGRWPFDGRRATKLETHKDSSQRPRANDQRRFYETHPLQQIRS